MASDILDRVGMVIANTGTGDVTANVLISARFNTPAEAGAANGKSYWWMLEEGSDYEIFEGVYTASGTKVARTTVWQSKIAGVHGTTKMTLAGNATLRSITPAELFDAIVRVDKVQAFNSGQQSQARSNIGAAAKAGDTFTGTTTVDAQFRLGGTVTSRLMQYNATGTHVSEEGIGALSGYGDSWGRNIKNATGGFYWGLNGTTRLTLTQGGYLTLVGTMKAASLQSQNSYYGDTAAYYEFGRTGVYPSWKFLMLSDEAFSLSFYDLATGNWVRSPFNVRTTGNSEFNGNVSVSGNTAITGSMTAGSKSFLTDHPTQPAEKDLVFMATEGPQAGLNFWGTAQLVDGQAVVDIDAASNMSAGTFAALTQRAIVDSLNNLDGFTRVRAGRIADGKFEILAIDESCADEIAWHVVAERADPYIKTVEWCDPETGILIPEHDKPDYPEAA